MTSDTKQWLLEILLMVIAVLALASAPARGAVLVSQGTHSIGYGKTMYSQITAQLDAAAVNGVTVASDFSNAAQVAAADALWLDIRGLTDALAPAEVANVTAFIATGKRVVMIGDHVDWTAWDNSILATVGGAWAADVGGTFTTAAPHALTSGVSSVFVFSGSAANAPAGATPLFSTNVATLWGPSQNVLTVLDSNLFDNVTRDTHAGSKTFGNNVAAWVGTPVPEPSGLAIAAALAGGLLRRRRPSQSH